MWRHSDPQLAASVSSALGKLASGDWSGPESANVRDVQALCAVKALIAGHLVGTVTYSTDSNGITTATFDADVNGDGERAAAARTLLAPLRAYALGAGLGPIPNGDIQTQAPSDAGVWPVAVIIAAVVVGGAVAGWCAHEASGLVRFFKSANDQKDTLQKADAQATELLSKHVQEEQNQGKAIPLSDAERAQLAILQKRTEELTSALAKKDAPSSSPVLPWYVWAGGGAVALVLIISLTSRGGVTLVQSPAARAA